MITIWQGLKPSTAAKMRRDAVYLSSVPSEKERAGGELKALSLLVGLGRSF